MRVEGANNTREDLCVFTEPGLDLWGSCSKPWEPLGTLQCEHFLTEGDSLLPVTTEMEEFLGEKNENPNKQLILMS